ncbi:MAG: 2-oxo acid dehydrogenase subunit E2 [Deltaproteobacteria bacterium]|nr:2-oxo acid dehydrogenase subunit E2 [Deltaproteobacteria bacterium]
MATEVTIPNLGYTMTVAKILRWLKSVGDTVEAGETLLEIETDKVTYGIESPATGIVKALVVNEGEEVPVGGVVAIVGAADEEIDVGLYRNGEKEKPAVEVGRARLPQGAPPTAPRPMRNGVPASPLVRKVARDKGIDLSLIRGSGRSGRIRMADLEKYLREFKQARAGAPPTNEPGEIAEIIPMTPIRRTIAQRLSQSSHDAPHFNLFTEVDMAEAIKLREIVREKIEWKTGVKLSLNDIYIKTVAAVLGDYPRLNARLEGDQIEVFRNINIGLAVALDDGLIVPAIEKADRKSLWQIATERKDLVERARNGRLSLHELERGTFTISNLGMYDIVAFTSILNPPQTGILSIGKTMDRPIVRDGSVVIRPMVAMTLAVDHRVVDGAVGARFLRDLKSALENPYLLF